MDAQNAVESATTGQAASSPKRVEQAEELKEKEATAVSVNSASVLANGRISSEAKLLTVNNGGQSMSDNETGQDQNSDAETIVLAKDGISPSKPRQSKFIKHEDKSDGEVGDIQPVPRKSLKQISESGRNGGLRGGEDERRRVPLVPGKKRLQDKDKQQQRNKDTSSGLSSVPASPPSHRRRRSGGAHSDSEVEEPSRSRALGGGVNRDKSRNGEKNLALKRRTTKVESEDDEPKKPRRPRMSDTSLDLGSTRDREHRSVSAKQQQGDRSAYSVMRSTSPHGRPHRRSLSTQLPSQYSNGLATKKRRVPAPLQSTDYQSDDSSASASSHPRNSKVKRLATPLTAGSTMSPAKTTGPKRHVDNHGQTQFAKACAKGEYDVAKRRLTERPEDLDFADYAGNTPLQVAALNGHEDIVELLIGAGCNLNCRNSDKETPLLDAVENGHLEVVKLLLDAGVNPRRADAEGHEPLEKVPDDLDNAEEIRAVLREAKDKSGEFRPSEDRQPQDPDTLSSQGPDSPRRSPQSSAAAQRRGGTGRSTKTSNHLLYMSLDEKTLRHAAARGDEETVTRVLQVREGCDDPEALVGAARGGHNVVMELLLALGGADPDPAPVKGLPPQYSTPMLAAIGQENAKVIKLLLNQSGFDPTRRFKGEYYYEIARRREGPIWKEEEHMLKNAYDDYRKAKGLGKKANPTARREREAEADPRRSTRKESSPEVSRPLKRRPTSPARDGEPKKKVQTSKAVGSPKEKRRADHGHQEDPPSPKRVSSAARPKKDEVVVNTNSDRESTPGLSKSSIPRTKRAESDLAAGSSDGEAFKPRRKLISGRDLKGQRERQRRSSMASTTSNDRDGKPDDVADKVRPERPSEKYHDRTKALKRDDSRDRHSGGEGSGKRHRASVTPPRQGTADRDDGEAPLKKRRLEAEPRDSRPMSGTSPDGRRKRRELSTDGHKRPKVEEVDRKEKPQKANRERALSVKSTTSERGSITVASEVPDIDMHDANVSEGEIQENKPAHEAAKRESAKKPQADAVAAAEEAKKQEERKRREEEEEAKEREEQENRRAAEEKRRQEELDTARLEEEARKRAAEQEQKRKEEEERKKRLEAEEKEKEKARVERERLAREEREKQEKEDAERREKEEEAKRVREAEEEKKRQEDEAKIRREKEAAEEARKVREEEERKERERKRAAREAEREAELQRVHQEQEKARLSKLPPVLRWLDTCPDPKQRPYAELFSRMQGVRYDTINSEATGTAAGREQWLLNTQVALLLGDKDLSLSRYTAWDKVKASNIAKKVIWKLEDGRYALTQGKLHDLALHLPDYLEKDPEAMAFQDLEKLRGAAARLFFDMDLFFVKASDFLYLVPTIPHLRGVKISMDYRELPDKESALNTWGATPAKWKQDPDANSRGHFGPRWKYFVDGQFVGEDKPKSYKPSRDPFPEHRVPRRGGLIAVSPHEPDYARLCLEQGLSHLLSEDQKQAALAGAHLTPKSMVSTEAAEDAANMSPSDRSPTAHRNHETTSPGLHTINKSPSPSANNHGIATN